MTLQSYLETKKHVDLHGFQDPGSVTNAECYVGYDRLSVTQLAIPIN